MASSEAFPKVLKDNDVRLVAYVPDNVLTPLIAGVAADDDFMPVCAAREDEAHALFAADHGRREAARMVQRWRIFFMASAELFGYDKGQEWWVSHYLFERPASK